MSKASKRRRRRARAARHGHPRGRGSRWVELVGPNVTSPTDALMRLMGYRRIRGKHGDAGGDFTWVPPCECRYHTRNKRTVPTPCPADDPGGHAEGTPDDMAPEQSWWRSMFAGLRSRWPW